MIKVYSQPGCIQCRMATKMLDDAGADFEVVDIQQDEEAYRFLKTIGAQQVPVLVNDAGEGLDIIKGFTPETRKLVKEWL